MGVNRIGTESSSLVDFGRFGRSEVQFGFDAETFSWGEAYVLAAHPDGSYEEGVYEKAKTGIPDGIAACTRDYGVKLGEIVKKFQGMSSAERTLASAISKVIADHDARKPLDKAIGEARTALSEAFDGVVEPEIAYRY